MTTFEDIVNDNNINCLIRIINGLFIWYIFYILFSSFFFTFVLINIIFYGIHAMFNIKVLKDFHFMDIIIFFINCIYYNVLLLVNDIVGIIEFIKYKRNKNQIKEEEENYEE